VFKRVLVSCALIAGGIVFLISGTRAIGTGNHSTPGKVSTLTYSTFLGGSGADGANDWLRNFSLEDSGTVSFASSTDSADFPVTAGAFDRSYNGGNEENGKEDAVIVRFDIARNALKYASYFGGAKGPDFVAQVLRKGGRTYLAGNTGAPDFPVTAGAFDTTFHGPDFRHADGYLAQFDGHALTHSTFVGTSGFDWIQKMFVAENGEIIGVGVFKEWNELPAAAAHLLSKEKMEGQPNACVVRLSPRGDRLLSLTVLGPTWYVDAARDSRGFVYVTGSTPSPQFPTSAGAYDTTFNGGSSGLGSGDIFVTKLTPGGDAIVFSTYLGGSGNDNFPQIALDASNNVLVYGNTTSRDWPVTPDARDKVFAGKKEGFLTKLSQDGSRLLYSSYIGGDEKLGEGFGSVRVGPNGDVYVCGYTDAADFPVTTNAIQSRVAGATDMFVSVFDSSLTALKFSTFLGGAGNEGGSIAVDRAGDIIGVGNSSSADFPTTPGAYSRTLNGKADLIIFKITLEHDERPAFDRRLAWRPQLTEDRSKLDVGEGPVTRRERPSSFGCAAIQVLAELRWTPFAWLANRSWVAEREGDEP
jgi:hypothetical protein